MRKVALVMALTAAGLPNWASALGLGDIDLNSYLNQPLEAEIPLRAVNQDELDSLHVGLASRADFARAGVDYQNSLRQLNFQVVRSGDQPVIKVTSSGDFREPFVSFLLEVNWNSGRIMREYTMLVDPPVIAGRGGAAVSAPRVQSQAQAPQQPQATQRRSVASQPRGLPAASRSGGTYGPTQRSDTLWTIASDVRPDESVSVEQTMMALQRLNPNAFIDDNVNQLKAGYVLKVPDRQQIETMTQAQARAEFRRQTQVWRTGTKPAMAADASESAPQTGTAPKGRLQLLAPGEAEGAADQAANQQTSSEAASGGEAADGVAGGSSAGTSEESAQLRAKVEQLQQQVQDMERLAQLKDDQLAALQAQLQTLRNESGAEATSEAAPAPTAEPAEAQGQQAGQAAPAPGQPAAAEAEASSPEGQSAAEPNPAEAASQTDADAPASDRFGPVVEAQRAAPDQAQNPYAVEGYQPVDLSGLPNTPVAQPFHDAAPVSAPAEPVASAPPAAGEPSVMDQINAWWQKSVNLFRDNPLYLGVAVAVFVLLLLALLAARQRRRAAAGFGESILQPAPSMPPETDRSMAAAAATGAVAAAAIGEAHSKEAEAEPESSYLSDFSISGIDSAIESEVSEADPLTEADVFLAYGRYQPAENMIKEAIDNEPDRLDLKIKLLEVYYAARNGEAFEREAQTVHGLIEDHSDPAWQKVMEMGRDLRPDSPLFDESATAAAVADEDDFSSADSADNEFAFPEDAAISAKSNDNMIDFDLGELEQSGQSESAGSGSDQARVIAAGAPQREDASDGLANSMADELSELAGAMEVDRQAPAGEQNADVADFDLGDLDLDPEGDQAYLNQPEPGEEDVDVVDGGLLADGDEVGTKLDLARAYIDMGDPDGARSILDEVLEEGSEDQKNEAQGLMAHMA